MPAAHARLRGRGRSLADDVVLHGDGGGKRLGVPEPIVGAARGLRLARGARIKGAWSGADVVCDTSINGLRGQVCIDADGLPQTIAPAIDAGRIKATCVTRNPGKPGHLQPLQHPALQAGQG